MELNDIDVKNAIKDVKEMRNILESGRPKLKKIFLSPSFGWLCITQAIFFSVVMVLIWLFKHHNAIRTILIFLFLADCVFAGKWKLDIFRHGAKCEEYDGSIISFFKLPFIKELLNIGYILVANTILISVLVAVRTGSAWLIYPLLFSGIGVTFLSYGATLKSYSYKITGIVGMLISFISALLYNGNMELWIAGGLGILFLTCGLAMLKEGRT